MNKYKNSFLLTAMLAVGSFLTVPTPAPAAEPQTGAGAGAAFSQRYRAGEVDFSTSYGLQFNSLHDGQADGFVGVGLDYFITRGFGLGVRAQIDDFQGSAIDRIGPRATVRAPLWDRLAPYGYTEGTYDLNADRWHIGTGAGLELRFARNLGAFGEAGVELDLDGRSTLRTSVGLRLSF